MKQCFSFIAFIFIAGASMAQGITKNDYARAVSFLFQNLNNKKVFNLNVQPVWSRDSSGFAFITQSKEGKLFNKIDLKKMQVEPLFDQQGLAKLLTDSLKKPVQSNNLSLNDLKYVDKNKISFTTAEKKYLLDLTTYQLSPDSSDQKMKWNQNLPMVNGSLIQRIIISI